MARKTVKRKAAARRGAPRKARRTARPAKRTRAGRTPSRAPRRQAASGALRSVAVAPGHAAERPSALEGLDVETSAPPREGEASDWDGLDEP